MVLAILQHWGFTSSGGIQTSIARELYARTQPPTLPTRGSRETMAALDTPLERGQALAIEGEYEAALEALTEATTEDASNAKAWEATAQVLLAASDDSDERSAAKALVAAQKAVDNAPLWAPAAVTRGRALLAARRCRGAAALSAVEMDFEDLSLRDEARADYRSNELRQREHGPAGAHFTNKWKAAPHDVGHALHRMRDLRHRYTRPGRRRLGGVRRPGDGPRVESNNTKKRSGIRQRPRRRRFSCSFEGRRRRAHGFGRSGTAHAPTVRDAPVFD